MKDDFDTEINDTYQHFCFIAQNGQKPYRIDKFLNNFIENSSRHKIQLAIKAGGVLVNAKVVKANYKVKPQDNVKVVLTYPERQTTVQPENIPLDIIYEDDYLAVVNKVAGMVVHPGYGNYSGTLVNALTYKWLHLPSTQKNEDNLRPGLVHRIDKDTSGLLVVAKEEFAMSHLASQFFYKTAYRTYLALAWGNIPTDNFEVVGYIGRSKQDRRVMSIYTDEKKGKWSKTNFEVLNRFRYFSLLKCVLETGRTHQIRTHLKHIRHPLFSDDTYGGNQILFGERTASYQQFIKNCQQLMPRQALHAKTLSFVHPYTKKQLFFESELPNDFTSLLKKLEKF